MTHPIAALNDEQLIAALLQYAPASGKDALQADFADAVYRYRGALEQIPEGRDEGRLLDVGARLYTATVYVNHLKYKEVSLATKWKTSYTDEALLAEIPGSNRISIQHFDPRIRRCQSNCRQNNRGCSAIQYETPGTVYTYCALCNSFCSRKNTAKQHQCACKKDWS